MSIFDAVCVACGKPAADGLPGQKSDTCGDLRCAIERDRIADFKAMDDVPPICITYHKWGPAITQSEGIDGAFHTTLRESCTECKRTRCCRCGQGTIMFWVGMDNNDPNTFCSACFYLSEADKS